jgi:hypothetical protein
VSRPVRPGEIRAIFTGMNTYIVGSYGKGWFKVTVLTPSGDIQIKDGFVNQLAAEKWAAKRRQTEARTKLDDRTV